jgi:hypothetical protein
MGFLSFAPPEGSGMRNEIVKCKDCHFWIPYTKEERGRGLGLKNMRPCRFFRSPKWLMPMHGDDSCGFGERKIGERKEE